MSSPLRCFSDYDELKSVIVGRSDGFRLPTLEYDILPDELQAATHAGLPESWTKSEDVATEHTLTFGVEYPAHLIAAANKGLDDLSKLLQGRGIEVLRPDPEGLKNQTAESGTRGHSSRDLMITIGDTLLIAPTPFRSRSREVDAIFSHIIADVKKGGGRVVDCRTEQYWQRAEGGPLCFLREDKTEKDQGTPLTEKLPLFDAANIIVLNEKTIVYQVSTTGNRAGAKYLEEELKRQGMSVVIFQYYKGAHIDSTILPLSRNKIIFCEGRVSLKEMKQLFEPHGYTDDAFIGFNFDDMSPIPIGLNAISSPWIGMNLLQIAPNVVVIEKDQVKVREKLQKHGVEVLDVTIPYTRDFAGALHCVTCPLKRQLIDNCQRNVRQRTADN